MKFRIRTDTESGKIGQFVLEVALSDGADWFPIKASDDRRWLKDVAEEYKDNFEKRERWLAIQPEEFEV